MEKENGLQSFRQKLTPHLLLCWRDWVKNGVLSELPSMSVVSFQLPAGIPGSVARGCKDHNVSNRAASLNSGVWSNPGKLGKRQGSASPRRHRRSH